VRPHREWKGSSTLVSSTSGSCLSAAPLPSQERTKGGDTTPQYWPMESLPLRAPEQLLPRPPLPRFGVHYIPRSQVNLGRLARPLEGATPFTVAASRRTTSTEEEGRGSPVVEPLTRGTADLSVTGRLYPTIEWIHHRKHRMKQTLTLTGRATVYRHDSHH
jgi:hypothetical protein